MRVSQATNRKGMKSSTRDTRFITEVQLHKEAYVSIEVAHKESGLFQPFSSLKQSQRSNLSLYDLGVTYKRSQGSPHDLGAQGRCLAI